MFLNFLYLPQLIQHFFLILTFLDFIEDFLALLYYFFNIPQA